MDTKQRYALRISRNGEPVGEYVFNATIAGLKQLRDNIKPQFTYDVLSHGGLIIPSDIDRLWMESRKRK